MFIIEFWKLWLSIELVIIYNVYLNREKIYMVLLYITEENLFAIKKIWVYTMKKSIDKLLVFDWKLRIYFEFKKHFNILNIN